jgi:Fe-S-cluster containining protein
MPAKIEAGEFSAWLRATRLSFRTGVDVDVSCGDCTACCSSSLFIEVSPDELESRSVIGEQWLVASPAGPPGFAMLGYDDHGNCPMLQSGLCGIYQQRPRTCRRYDCRIFVAAGIPPSDESTNAIAQQVKNWQFSYANEKSITQHSATRAAAKFVRENPSTFPINQIPTLPSDLAVLAVKVYEAFIDAETLQLIELRDHSPEGIAASVVETFRTFERCASAGAKELVTISQGRE